VLLGYCGAVSWTTLFIFAVLYFVQIALYKPHLSRGWYPFLLYSSYDVLLGLCDNVQGYHHGTMVREGPQLDESGKYLFAMYPHGIFGVCRAFSGGRSWKSLFGSITARWGSFGTAFYIPGVREFSLSAGCLDAGKKTLVKAINHGENIILLPGGIKEMMLTDGESSDTQLVMKDRKGYAKLAIENGLTIVPGFCFGEKRVHDIVLLPMPIRKFLLRWQLSACLMKGRGWTFLGKEKPLAMVWGEAVPTTQMADVSVEYLDEVHAKVEKSVHSIFERYKLEFGYDDSETCTSVASGEVFAKKGA